MLQVLRSGDWLPAEAPIAIHGPSRDIAMEAAASGIECLRGLAVSSPDADFVQMPRYTKSIWKIQPALGLSLFGHPG